MALNREIISSYAQELYEALVEYQSGGNDKIAFIVESYLDTLVRP
jgi:hypothetical protein